MENVVAVEEAGDGISRWTIKGPAGREITLVNRITETALGESIFWQSTPDSDIANSGEVRFADAPNARGPYVCPILPYHPPGGTLGRLGPKPHHTGQSMSSERGGTYIARTVESET